MSDDPMKNAELLQSLRVHFQAAIYEDSCRAEHAESALEYLVTWIKAEATRIADERIAAIQLQGMDIGGKWLDHPSFRVKPKEGA